MSAELIAVLAVIFVALAFDYTNGFHDAANAIATSVSTRALTPRRRAGHGRDRQLRRRALRRERRQDGRQRPGRAADRHRPASASSSPAWSARSLEPDHLVLRPAVVVVPRADRRPGRRDAARRPARCCGTGIVEKVVTPDDVLAAGRLRARLRLHARDPVDLPERPARQAQPRLPVGADRLGGGDVGRSRHAGRGQDDRHHRAGALRRRLPGQPGRTSRSGRSGPRRRCWRWARTPAAGGSSARSAARSSTSARPRASPPRPWRARCSTSTRWCSARRSPPPTRSPRRSWASGATKKLSAVRWGVAGNIVGAWILTFPAAGSIGALIYFIVRPLFS